VSSYPPLVALRPLGQSDAKVIASWTSDPEFCRAAEWSQSKSPLEHLQFQQRLISSLPETLVRLGAIELDRLIGYVDLQGRDHRRRELGFVIGGRENWNRGLGRAVAAAGIRHGFEQLNLQEIWAEAISANVGSIRVLESVGMLETGFGDEAIYLGIASRYRQFEITRAAWESARGDA
jgi:RimJ/RimL family protein N-acetyltransferase